MKLNTLDNACLSALKLALNGYQQFETSHPEASTQFRKVVETLIGPIDGVDVWAIRNYIQAEDDRRINGAQVVVSSSEAYQLISKLGDQERRILRFIAEGYQPVVIANMLGISYRTIANHKANITTKLGLGTAKDLTQFAIKNLKFL